MIERLRLLAAVALALLFTGIDILCYEKLIYEKIKSKSGFKT